MKQKGKKPDKSNKILTLAKPTYLIEEEFILKNYGSIYYYPPEKMKNGLQELIIFAENATKHGIPNGSLWVYDAKSRYFPEILMDDIGCGVTSFIISAMEYSDAVIMDILKVVDEIHVDIGHGNHFIDFTTEHPKAEKSPIRTNMLFLHTDFNKDKTVPKDHFEAMQMEKQASERRIDYLDRVVRLLGIKGDVYKDWVHNSLSWKDDRWIYRKGCIDLDRTENEGILLLNPFEGIYLYVGTFEAFYSSAQHATGRKNEGKIDRTENETLKYGMARGMPVPNRVPSNLHLEFNDVNIFQNAFRHESLCTGCCIPYLVVTTRS